MYYREYFINVIIESETILFSFCVRMQNFINLSQHCSDVDWKFDAWR